MQAHRFQIGEIVAASAFGVPPGPYRITRLLPVSDNGDLNYRAEDLPSGQQRALVERSMRPWIGQETKIQGNRVVRRH